MKVKMLRGHKNIYLSVYFIAVFPYFSPWATNCPKTALNEIRDKIFVNLQCLKVKQKLSADLTDLINYFSFRLTFV